MLCVLFPVDFRYGWNLHLQDHRSNMDLVSRQLRPEIIYDSPDSGAWAVSSKRLDPVTRSEQRVIESPLLTWSHSSALLQCHADRSFIQEQPMWADSWTLTDLSKTQDLPSTRKRQQVDMCRHNVTDSRGTKIKRTTGLQTNIKLKSSAKRCICNSTKHSNLEMLDKRQTMVYGRNFCKALISDMTSHLQHTNKLFHNSSDGESYNALWVCPKCKHGSKTGLPHTFKELDCRLYRPTTRPPTHAAPTAVPQATPTPTPTVPVVAPTGTIPNPGIDGVQSERTLQAPASATAVAKERPLTFEDLDLPTINKEANIIIPNFGMKTFAPKCDAAGTEDKLKLLLGLHVRCWHAAPAEMVRIV